MTKDELIATHGTLEEFTAAVWCASDQLFITPEEATAAIKKYQDELQPFETLPGSY